MEVSPEGTPQLAVWWGCGEDFNYSLSGSPTSSLTLGSDHAGIGSLSFLFAHCEAIRWREMGVGEEPSALPAWRMLTGAKASFVVSEGVLLWRCAVTFCGLDAYGSLGQMGTSPHPVLPSIQQR